MRCLIRISVLSCCVALLVAPLMLPTTTQAMFSITIYFGKRGCEPGVGICRIVIGAARDAARRGVAERATSSSDATASIEAGKSGTQAAAAADYFLKISGMKQAIPGEPSVVPVAEDLTLDAATSRALGHKSVKVLKGDYKVDYSKDKMGALNLKIEWRD